MKIEMNTDLQIEKESKLRSGSFGKPKIPSFEGTDFGAWRLEVECSRKSNLYSKDILTQSDWSCLCILLPLMGCTWAIGIFYVNKDMAWIQYVFAVCNSLQGFVIFIFHCALNTQIRIAIQRKQRKYSSSFSRTQSTTKPVSLPRVSSASSSFDIYNSISSETDGNSRSSVYDSGTDNRLVMIGRSRKNSTRDDSVRKNETRYHR